MLLSDAPLEVLFFACFRVSKHINILELRRLILNVRYLAKKRRRRCRVLIGLDSRVVLGAASKGRSSSRSLNFHLRRLAIVTTTHEIALVLFWLPAWGNPADAPSRFASLDDWRAHFPYEAVDWEKVCAIVELAGAEPSPRPTSL